MNTVRAIYELFVEFCIIESNQFTILQSYVSGR